MSQRPLQLGLRFLLEMAAFAIFAYWGWAQGSGLLRLLYALGLPLLGAAVWAATAVREDPTRSGRAFLSVPGALRLVIELVLFGAAAWMLYDMQRGGPAAAFAAIVFVHYLLSYDRIAWLIRQR